VKKIIALLSAVFVLGGTAWAACTPDEAQAKADAVSKKVQETAQTDRAKAIPVIQEIGVRIPEFQKNPYDIEALCAFYDEMLDKLQ